MNVKEGELAEGRVKEGREEGRKEGKNGMKERKKTGPAFYCCIVVC